MLDVFQRLGKRNGPIRTLGGRARHVRALFTVTGSDAFGLPTLLDDEVLLGLIQLTRQRDFADRKVPFMAGLLTEECSVWWSDKFNVDNL